MITKTASTRTVATRSRRPGSAGRGGATGRRTGRVCCHLPPGGAAGPRHGFAVEHLQRRTERIALALPVGVAKGAPARGVAARVRQPTTTAGAAPGNRWRVFGGAAARG